MIALGLGAVWAVMCCWLVADATSSAAVRLRDHSHGEDVSRETRATASAAATAFGTPALASTAQRRVALALLMLVLLVIHPLLAFLAVLAAVAAPRLRVRAVARRARAAVVDELPDVVDLLRLTTAAGLPVQAAIRAVGRRPGGRVGAALDVAAGRLQRGGSTADALDALLQHGGPHVRSLVDTLHDHVRYGTPLVPVLDRLAVESRLQRRRQGEEAARRLPVTLLFPLVLTTLPAFVVLAVIPLLAGSFGSLGL